MAFKNNRLLLAFFVLLTYVLHFNSSSSVIFCSCWFLFIYDVILSMECRIGNIVLLMLFFVWTHQCSIVMTRKCVFHRCSVLHWNVSRCKNCFASLKNTSMMNRFKYIATMLFVLKFLLFVVKKTGSAKTAFLLMITLCLP